MPCEQRVFNANMCFICHASGKDVSLKYCASCKLVQYCSVSHQKMHWKYHKEFCGVIRKVESSLPPVNVENDRNWYKYRTKLWMLCEISLGRKLKTDEMKMILFPNNCQICHKKTDLKACWDCLCVSYCSDDHKNADIDCHSSDCNLFSLCCKIDFYEEKSIFYPNYNVRQGDIELMDDISFFIKSNIILKRTPVCQEIEEALLSEFLTCPLSLLYALSKISYTFTESAVVHIVGSSKLETAYLKSWDIILDVHKHIKHLTIQFIGPDMKILCNLPCLYEGKLNIMFSDKFYHDFLLSKAFRQPDVVCAFNCGFHEIQEALIFTWKKSLPFMLQNKKSPLIFTSFNEDEAKEDLKQLLEVDPNLNTEIERNPFSSLRPYRDPENLGVFFNNKYLGIVKPRE